jgi:hypothetical protein
MCGPGNGRLFVVAGGDVRVKKYGSSDGRAKADPPRESRVSTRLPALPARQQTTKLSLTVVKSSVPTSNTVEE